MIRLATLHILRWNDLNTRMLIQRSPADQNNNPLNAHRLLIFGLQVAKPLYVVKHEPDQGDDHQDDKRNGHEQHWRPVEEINSLNSVPSNKTLRTHLFMFWYCFWIVSPGVIVVVTSKPFPRKSASCSPMPLYVNTEVIFPATTNWCARGTRINCWHGNDRTLNLPCLRFRFGRRSRLVVDNSKHSLSVCLPTFIASPTST